MPRQTRADGASALPSTGAGLPGAGLPDVTEEQQPDPTTDGRQEHHARGSRVSTLAKNFDRKHHPRWSVEIFGDECNIARVYGNIVGGSAGTSHWQVKWDIPVPSSISPNPAFTPRSFHVTKLKLEPTNRAGRRDAETAEYDSRPSARPALAVVTGEDTLLEAPPEGQRTVLAIENDAEDDEDPETDEDYDPAADSGAEDELADDAGDGDGADRTELLLHKQPCPVTKADWKLNGEHVTWQYVGQSQEALVAASLPGQVPIETARSCSGYT